MFIETIKNGTNTIVKPCSQNVFAMDLSEATSVLFPLDKLSPIYSDAVGKFIENCIQRFVYRFGNKCSGNFMKLCVFQF